MANSLQFAVNKTNVESDIANIDYYIERLSEIETSLVNEFNEVKEYYITDSSNIFFEKVDLLIKNFTLINSNLNGYKNDLKKLTTLVDEQDILLTRKIESGMASIK